MQKIAILEWTSLTNYVVTESWTGTKNATLEVILLIVHHAFVIQATSQRQIQLKGVIPYAAMAQWMPQKNATLEVILLIVHHAFVIQATSQRQIQLKGVIPYAAMAN